MLTRKLVPSLLLVGALAVGMTPTSAKAQINLGQGVVINNVNLTNFQVVDNVLTAAGTVSGTIGGLPFTTDISNFALQLLPDDPTTPATECSVLDLTLAPINLALLGLHVDTSPICLDITATEGGGILGDLLCSLAGGDLLGGLPVIPGAADVTQLQAGLADLLAGALTDTFQTAQADDMSVCTGETEVLNLALGPIDLSLLGLNVSLDDCDEGPVQVCVSATASEGLLGSLLAGLAGGDLLGGLNLGQLGDILDAVLGGLGIDIGDLLNGLLNGQAVAGPNASAKQVNQLVNQLGHALRNSDLSNRELSNLTKAVQKIVRKS